MVLNRTRAVVVTSPGFIDECKSNYHTNTTTPLPPMDYKVSDLGNARVAFVHHDLNEITLNVAILSTRLDIYVHPLFLVVFVLLDLKFYVYVL
jgi:hypothetical protein